MTKSTSFWATRLVRNSIMFLHLIQFGGTPVAGLRPRGSAIVIRPPPQITLTMYSEVDSYRQVSAARQFPLGESAFGNDFVSKNGSEYIIYEGTQSVAFSCEADYPVTWNSPLADGTTTYDFRISQFSQSMETPQNKRYITFIRISFRKGNFVSGGLNCGSIEITPSLETSIFVYKIGNAVLENEGETVIVHAVSEDYHSSKDLPPLVIPCRPNSPKLKLSLQKKITVPSPQRPNSSVTLWNPVKPSGTEVTFDPKIGFTLQRTFLRNSVYGIYRCFVTDDDEDYDEEVLDPSTHQMVLVNVLKAVETSGPIGEGVETFHEKVVITGKATFEMAFLEESTDIGTVKCCTGNKNKPPHLFLRDCVTPVECKWAREAILKDKEALTDVHQHFLSFLDGGHQKLPSDCRQTLALGMVAVVKCTGENVDVLQEYTMLFHPQAGGPVVNRSQRLAASESKSGIKEDTTRLFEYVKTSPFQNVAVSRKMIILVGYRGEAPSKDKIRHEVNFLKSSSILLSIYYGADDRAALRWKDSYIYEYERDVYYSGEPLTFLCVGSQTFYSNGVVVRLNWKNGSNIVVSRNMAMSGGRKQREMFSVYLSANAMLPFGVEGGEGITEEPAIAEEGMDSVDCFMPVTGSTRWDKLSRKVQVLPSVTPTFEEAETEDVYFYVGDVNRTVSCTIKDGMPSPQIRVYRDGKLFKITEDTGRNMTGGDRQNDTTTKEIVDRNERVTHVDINFDVVKHSHQLVLRCSAGNVKGVANRTVRVFVLDKPNKTVPITVAIIGILGITLGALAVKLWLLRRGGASQ